MIDYITLTKTAQTDHTINKSIREDFIIACEKLDISSIEALISEENYFE